jgi:D-3-phosphoglycerate dehydrogenase
MKRANPDVNMVSAPVVARKRRRISPQIRTKSARSTGIKVTVVTDKRGFDRRYGSLTANPLYPDQEGINIDAEWGASWFAAMTMCARHRSSVHWSRTMGENGVNIT